jgi:hypothetical protein
MHEDALVLVRLHLPLVGCVGLRDIDESHRRSLAERLEKRLDIARPATKGWSGVAAEDEHERPGLDELAETYGARVLHAEELGLGDGVAHLEAIGLLVAKDRGDDGGALLGVVDALHVLTISLIEEGLRKKRVASTHPAEVWR